MTVTLRSGKVSAASTPSSPTLQQEEQQTLSMDVVSGTEYQRTMDASAAETKALRYRYFAFWALGILNNASYVIMIAAAKSISEGGTGLVFVANIVPSLTIKATSPYWFHLVSYRTRMIATTVLMVAAYLMVGAFTSMYWQLLGVAFASAQCGLGEASLLALAGKYDMQAPKAICLSCFSSGTGFAGVFGFLWKFLLVDYLGMSLRAMQFLACFLVLLYGGIYVVFLSRDTSSLVAITRSDGAAACPDLPTANSSRTVSYQNLSTSEEGESGDELIVGNESFHDEPSSSMKCSLELQGEDMPTSDSEQEPPSPVDNMTLGERVRAVLELYPYMIPLWVVYFAEYALQAGAWTAIGFPVTSMEARDSFFTYSNWMYQVGVLVSRSTGTLFTCPLWLLWLMPALQVVNLIFFAITAVTHDWMYNSSLLGVCFYVGLLGGGVYIHTFTRICNDVPKHRREFALATTSVAESLGIISADLTGLYIQACLYDSNQLSGALVTCPIRM